MPCTLNLALPFYVVWVDSRHLHLRFMASSFDISSLNRAQRHAVETLNGPVLILAGAGTGKTRTVTCRIAHMIERGIQSQNILSLTFTNKAANEMRERVAGMLSKRQAKDMVVSTFHSLCVKLLRADATRLGYRENFSIFTGSDQNDILRKLIIRHGGRTLKVEPKHVLFELGKMKNAGGTTDMIKDDFLARIAQDYLVELKIQNAMDFDDLLVLSEKLLRENPDVRQKWRDKFRYITVDEFQDTNSLQMALLNMLVGEEQNICVVGDDDQSIYGWRGADITNILQFERFFPNPTVIKLEENYRCTKPILDIANVVIKNNVGRREKQLITNKTGGDVVRLFSMPGDREEAEFIVDEIYHSQRKDHKKWEDFAILFRANTQSRILEQSLREKSIPYRMVGAQSFYDRSEVKDIIAYLSIMVNPDADIHTHRIVNVPSRGIGEKALILAAEWGREHNKSLWDCMDDDGYLSLLSTRARHAIESFMTMMKGYKERFSRHEEENLSKVMKEMMEEIGYPDYIRRFSKTENEADKRLASLGEIENSLQRAVDHKKSLAEFIEHINLDNQRDDDDIESKQGVCLITLHAAKGLEFPTVYLVGVEQGILPHKRSLEEKTCDEERRLFYVGITRAQKKLTMTYCGSRIKYGERVLCEPSMFINEIPHEMYEWEDYDELMNKPLSEEEMGDFFANLRGMLDE